MAVSDPTDSSHSDAMVWRDSGPGHRDVVDWVDEVLKERGIWLLWRLRLSLFECHLLDLLVLTCVMKYLHTLSVYSAFSSTPGRGASIRVNQALFAGNG